jgi:hypothetical protein
MVNGYPSVHIIGIILINDVNQKVKDLRFFDASLDVSFLQSPTLAFFCPEPSPVSEISYKVLAGLAE